MTSKVRIEYLFDGPYSFFSMSLAQVLGLHEAIFLDRLNFWLQQDEIGKEMDGRRWVYNSYPGWQEQFPFFTVRQIRVLIQRLEGEGFLLSRDDLNKFGYDHTKWYTINYGLLDELSVKATSPKLELLSSKATPSATSGRGPDAQGRTIPVNTSVNTSEQGDDPNTPKGVLGKSLKIVDEDLSQDNHSVSPIDEKPDDPREWDDWVALLKTKGKPNLRIGVLARFVKKYRPAEAEAAGKTLYSHLGKLVAECKTAESALKFLNLAHMEGGENLIVYAGVLQRTRKELWGQNRPAEETKRFA